MERLNDVAAHFNNQIDGHARAFAQEEAKLSGLKVKVHCITDRLEAILQRAASRMTIQEANAASRVEELESTVDKLTHTLSDVCAYIGLPFSPPPILARQPLIGQLPAAQVTWLGGSSSSQQVEVQRANVDVALYGLNEAAIPVQSVAHQPWYGTPQTTVSLDTAKREGQASREQQAAAGLSEAAIQDVAPPPPALSTFGAQPAGTSTTPDELHPPSPAPIPHNGSLTAPSAPFDTAPPAIAPPATAPPASATAATATAATAPPATAPPAALLPAIPLTATTPTPSSLPSATSAAIAHEVPLNEGQPPSKALLTVPGATTALATAPLAPPSAATSSAPISSPGSRMNLDPLPHSGQEQEVIQPHAHPKIQRVPATPQNSQDTQATHVTLPGSSQTDIVDPSTATHPAGAATTPQWSETAAAQPGPLQFQTLAVPGRPRTRSQSRSASEDNGERDSVKRKRSNDDEAGRKMRRRRK